MNQKPEPILLPISGEDPLCSGQDVDPTWWDLETHTHSGHWSCTPCRAAIEVCDRCPLKAKCAMIGQKVANPWFIYAAKAWNSNGEVWACRQCRAPIQGSGRRRESGMCSSGCETLYRDSRKPNKSRYAA